MASSDSAAAAVEPKPTGPPSPLKPTISESTRVAVPAEWWAIALALVVPWWLPVLAETAPTFYKEWLFVLAFAFAGLIAKPLIAPSPLRFRQDPFTFAAIAAVAVLLVQIAVYDGVARRAALMICCAAFFAFSIALGHRIKAGREDSLVWIAWCLLAAALGSSVLAAAQVALPEVLFVLPRSGGRLSGNIAQANHFCDLLWIGCVAAAYLFSRGSLGARTAGILIAALQVFAATSGSRMAWIYAGALALICVFSWRRGDRESRRFSAALLGVVVSYGLVTAFFAGTGLLENLSITSAEHRFARGDAASSSSQRLWFWRVGVAAAVDHPLLGVGAGRFAGEGLDMAMRALAIPFGAADAQAHNIFIQLAAECGIPLALCAAVALAVWLTRAWREPSRGADSFAVIAMAAPILVHANLEHPLGYLYFLGLLGLLVGQIRSETRAPVDRGASRVSPELLRYASFVVLAVTALAYVQFTQVERAMRLLSAQVRAGVPPQATRELDARLAAIPGWSMFGDDAELIALIAALPTSANAAGLGQRCERSIAIGPSPQLLARCATALQVAGRTERASYFANSMCKLYPEAAPVLIQSMTYVEQVSPVVENLRSTCVQRAN